MPTLTSIWPQNTLRWDQGMQVFFILLNLIIKCRRNECVMFHTFQSILHLFRLGFMINWKKSSLYLLQRVDYLEVVLNSHSVGTQTDRSTLNGGKAGAEHHRYGADCDAGSWQQWCFWGCCTCIQWWFANLCSNAKGLFLGVPTSVGGDTACTGDMVCLWCMVCIQDLPLLRRGWKCLGRR